MAWSERQTVVANPARRPRRVKRAISKRRGLAKKNPTRKVKRMARRLSIKQRLHFGSKAQRAAARRAMSGKRKAKRTNAARRTMPARKRKNNSVARHRPRRRKNPGEIIAMTLAPLGNPAKRRTKKVATSRRRKNASRRRSNAGRPRRRRNPSIMKRHSHRRRRSNPGKMGNLVMDGVAVIGGAVGSKMLTQMVLGASNTSFTGYAGNAVATGLLAWGAHLFTHNRELASFIAAGGVAQLVVRIMSDLTPYGAMLSGSGLGDYQTANFWMPPRMVNAPSSSMYSTDFMPPVVTATQSAGSGMGCIGDGNTLW